VQVAEEHKQIQHEQAVVAEEFPLVIQQSLLQQQSAQVVQAVLVGALFLELLVLTADL
jgi:hypothetical protein